MARVFCFMLSMLASGLVLEAAAKGQKVSETNGTVASVSPLMTCR